MAAELSVELPRSPEAPFLARRALAELADEVDPSVLPDVRLLVSELITNSVKHGWVGGLSEVRLDVVATRWLIRVEVHDNGPGFEPVARTSASPLNSHWGLYLVEELADRWQVVSGAQTLVWFEIDREATADSLPAPWRRDSRAVTS
jgi:anti-sigma regulatory factor (Ser/Thr protein kinase)